jgi:hypothetical protein
MVVMDSLVFRVEMAQRENTEIEVMMDNQDHKDSKDNKDHLHQVVEGTLTSDGVVLCARMSLELVLSTVAGLLAAITLILVVEQTTFVSPRHRSTSTTTLQLITVGWCMGRNTKPVINLIVEYMTKMCHVPSVTSPNDQC